MTPRRRWIEYNKGHRHEQPSDPSVGNCQRCRRRFLKKALLRERWCLPCAVILGQVDICNSPEAQAEVPPPPERPLPKFHIPHNDYFIDGLGGF